VLQYRSILAPTDFSTHAGVALRHACSLAHRLGAELHLLHVLPDFVPASPDPMLAPNLPPEYFNRAEAKAREALSTLLEPDWGRPASVKLAVHWGSAVDGIVGYASDHAVDLVVIATHGRTGLRHVLLGSVAERIIREAPCPVLTVRDRS
jgi:universal stress protein A